MEESKQNKVILLRQMIENAERNIIAAKQILTQIDGGPRKSIKDSEASQIVEGSFDGEKMIGLDGKKYPVPPNYASKSKLIEGDLLKLTVTEDGAFLYKQISPAERRKTMGTVMKDSNGKYYVSSEGRKYKVLLASLTYFKAREGDEVTLVVPKEKISKWAAIEAVINITTDEGAEEIAPEVEEKPVKGKKKKKTAKAEPGIKEENEGKDEVIADEWTPDIEDMKKEAQFRQDGDEISDDLSNS